MEHGICNKLRRRGLKCFFKLYFYLLANVSRLCRNSLQFANLLSLLISPVVTECTNQIKMARRQRGELTCIVGTTDPVHSSNPICWCSLLTPFRSGENANLYACRAGGGCIATRLKQPTILLKRYKTERLKSLLYQ